MIEPTDSTRALILIDRYVCSGCWGHLIPFHTEDGQTLVKCHSCMDDTPGYVTKYYASMRRAESIIEAYEARRVLKDYLPHEPKRDEAVIMNELGF